MLKNVFHGNTALEPEKVPSSYEGNLSEEEIKIKERIEEKLIKKSIRKSIFSFLQLLLILICVCGGILYLDAKVFYLQKELNAIDVEISEIEDIKENLNLKILELTSVERLRDIAINELGMRYPKPEDYVKIPYNESDNEIYPEDNSVGTEDSSPQD